METKQFINQEWVKTEIQKRVKYDPDTGSLTWAERPYCKHFNEGSAGRDCTNSSRGRLCVKFEVKGRRVSISAARIAWLCYYGDWPEHTVDHIDRDPSNNKVENLRDVTQSENNYNKGHYRDRKNKFRGVCQKEKKNKKFNARITKDRVTVSLGYFYTEEEAARAYDKKAKELFGDFATLNFPEDT